MPKTPPKSPLEGIRILDLTSVIMGPFATRILGDMGADVIKIEPPEGEMLRTPSRRVSAMMLNLYRNKRSVVLDLKAAEGKDALRRLIRTADVLVHNLRPQVMARLGFTYEAVAALNPKIIYCAAHGFGAAGPYGPKAAYDDLIQAGSGFAAAAIPVTGAPAYAPAVICDKVAGQTIAYAILAGLLQRERGGGGQCIEVPMFETAIDFNLVEGYGGVVYEPPRGPPGYARIQTPERRPYPTADGYACILPYSDQNWRDFFAYVGLDSWADDPRFLKRPDRITHADTLYAMIRREAPKRTTAEWVAFCDGADIPCMPMIDVEHMAEDPHVQAVNLLPVAEHPTEGAYRAVRPPVTFSAAPYVLRSHAPTLGEHTAAVMAELKAWEADQP